MINTYTLPFFDADADNSAQTLVDKPSFLFKIIVENPNTAKAYVQLFDALAADVTVGTTVPNYVIPVFANSGTVDDYAVPMKFKNGITYACTTTPTGSTDPTAGLVLSANFS
jgi:hypothetical protein